ncbi:MAG TPA: hypothetical protein VHV77_03950, partial [Pirellulales bacterium]|nr:hypothetical protein [Pirellulales bacterium]
MDRARLRKLSFTLVQWAVALGIIAYLVVNARKDKAFANLINEPKQWGFLAAAWVSCMLGVVLTIVRWHRLVLAL